SGDEALGLDGGQAMTHGDPKRVVGAYLTKVEEGEETLLAATTARAVEEASRHGREGQGGEDRGGGEDPGGARTRGGPGRGGGGRRGRTGGMGRMGGKGGTGRTGWRGRKGL